ncbi:hypothetical protein BN946_scf184855.g9 [Trametes cinnabarina]|uniref:Uncharacterized protein n=1 Tax=Pycnoporus cinnabarinus TaxID=5643 RepID=A0A060SMK7_PYCCI|nr:hypothetical protein BN946_scf184855.g9 [Trametes cinnabarina]
MSLRATSLPHYTLNIAPSSLRTLSADSRRPALYSRQSEAVAHRISSQATSTTAVTQSRSPVKNKPTDHNRASALMPSPGDRGGVQSLNTRRLKPQTLKVSGGQLVVLPSKSVLVDFREGERRKGRKGKEVLMISVDGGTVQVYDAPHLSTPCCLAEAAATYAVSQLPQKYGSMYRETVRLVDELKSRIPKLVHYLDDAKCTLMANGPLGDIEVVIPGDEDRKKSSEAIRIRLQRHARTLEISRYRVRSGKGKAELGEWTKKVMALGPHLEVSEEDKTGLDSLDELAMGYLFDFLPLCAAASGVATS